MRIIAKKTLRESWEANPDTTQYLKTWYATVKEAEWKTPADIKETYATASILGSGRVVFNIKGNHYRLIVKIHFNRSTVFIRFIGTHAEYDNIDANAI